MPGMPLPREYAEPSVADSTPMPIRVGELAPGSTTTTTSSAETDPKQLALPNAESVFRAVAAATGPWFPARFALEAGVPREALDLPLQELRLAGLITVADWVRGVGQGYKLTPEGEALAANAAEVPRVLGRAMPAAPAPTGAEEDVPTEVPPPRAGEIEFTPPVVVPLLLVINGLWFAVCASWSIRWGLTPSRAISEGHPEVLHRFGAVSGVDLLAGDWWRLLTACFVHHGALHLLMNLMALAMLGPLAELLWGRWRLLAIYLLSGLAGSALAMALHPDALLAGASGAIWGIHISLFVWLYAHRTKLPPEVVSDWLRRLTVVLLLNTAASALPRVSWEGHLGGGLAGFAVAGLLLALRSNERRQRIAAVALLGLIPFACLGGVGAAMGAKGIPAWQQLKQRLAQARGFDDLTRSEAEFHAGAAPRLSALAQQQVDAAETSARFTLSLSSAPQRAARDTARFTELKRAADELAALAVPTGNEALDGTRAAVRAFAEARARALGKGLELLAKGQPPTPDERAAWDAARREANDRWNKLGAK
jgi:rhomboid protease GluP